MQKILYAINAKEAEDKMTEALRPKGVVSTGAIAYKERILPALTETPADILVFREDLKGSTPVFDLMKEIRIEFPLLRIVFIGNSRPVTDSFYAHLVFLGIYDIINDDRPVIDEIVSLILEPKTFAYASKYFQDRYMDDLVPPPPEHVPEEPAQPVKRSPLAGLIGRFAATAPDAPESPAPPAAPAAAAAPAVPSLTADFEVIRSAMKEEARREAQAEIPQLVEMQVEAATAALKADIARQQEAVLALRKDLSEKVRVEEALRKQLEEAGRAREALEAHLKKTVSDAEKMQETYQAQIVSLQTTRSVDWYKEQTERWMAEREALQTALAGRDQEIDSLTKQLHGVTAERDALSADLTSKSEELAAMALTVPRDISDAVDDALEVDHVSIPDDVYTPLPEGKVIAFMGAKHGVGNSTAAMNTAIALANRGYKTLCIEFDRESPMMSRWFEFNIVRGLDTAILALRQEERTLVSRCIIKPHGVQGPIPRISKIYQRLPGPLHFLLFSNEYLRRYKEGTAPEFDAHDLDALLRYLISQEGYSCVILDIQADDRQMFDMLVDGSCKIDQLVLTLTQDPHAIAMAGYVITRLSRERNRQLINGARFLVDQYVFTGKMTLGKIASFLHVDRPRISRISLDTKGYMDSAFSAVPYMTAKGKCSNEYIDLRMKLLKS